MFGDHTLYLAGHVANQGYLASLSVCNKSVKLIIDHTFERDLDIGSITHMKQATASAGLLLCGCKSLKVLLLYHDTDRFHIINQFPLTGRLPITDMMMVKQSLFVADATNIIQQYEFENPLVDDRQIAIQTFETSNKPELLLENIATIEDEKKAEADRKRLLESSALKEAKSVQRALNVAVKKFELPLAGTRYSVSIST